MKELSIAIKEVRDEISNDRQYYENNEEETRNKLINPILLASGWNISDVKNKNVKTQFPINYPTGGRRKLDYLLIKGPKKVLVIEAKKLGNNIPTPIVVDQIQSYCRAVKVEYGLITNGLIWILINTEKITAKDTGILWELNIVDDDFDIISQKLQTISFFRINRIEEGANEVKLAIQLKQVEQQEKQNEIERKNESLERSWKQFIKNRKKIANEIFILYDSCLNTNNTSRDKFTKSEILTFLQEKILMTFNSELIGNERQGITKKPMLGSDEPTKVIIKNSQPYILKRWKQYEILTYGANWLIKKGKLKASNCPVSVTRGEKYLVNIKPIHKDGTSFSGKQRLDNGLWIETAFNSGAKIRYVKILFEQCHVPQDTIRVE